MSIFVRIWLAFTLVIMFAGVVGYNQLHRFIRPTAQQAVEDTLVDIARLLAVDLVDEVATGSVSSADFYNHFAPAFEQTHHEKTAWYYQKQHSQLYIYITDAQGNVLYNSTGQDVGADYSQWNDVYLTLHGQYGARSTRSNPTDENSSIMYVAAPIKQHNQLIGVVSVGKASRSLLPYLERTKQQMLTTVTWVGLFALGLALLVSLWIRRSIKQVTNFTQSLANQHNKPFFFLASELNSLSDSIATMRDTIENKAYVTQYVHTLTHELKSPITAIRASSELLADDLPQADRQQFSEHIIEQTVKLQGFIDKLLLLAKLEQPSFKLHKSQQDITALIFQLVEQNMPKVIAHGLTLEFKHTQPVYLNIDSFWFNQAVQNVLDNAIDFAKKRISICFIKQVNSLTICLYNDGEPLPEFALNKVFERYFSLSHQPTNAQSTTSARKGTGIGLTLVKEVIEKHGGTVSLTNTNNSDDAKNTTPVTTGVSVQMCLPAWTTTNSDSY